MTQKTFNDVLLDLLGDETTTTAAPKPERKPDANTKELLDFIARHEVSDPEGGYDIMYGGKRKPDILDMSLDDVIKYQSTIDGPSTAIGRYQFLKDTLKDLKKKAGLSGKEKFTPELQDTLALKLLERRGFNKFREGKIAPEDFMYELAKEWASLPKDRSGRSYYDGDGLNKALVGADEVLKILSRFRDI